MKLIGSLVFVTFYLQPDINTDTQEHHTQIRFKTPDPTFSVSGPLAKTCTEQQCSSGLWYITIHTMGWWTILISEPISSGRDWVDWEQMEHKVVFSICSQTTLFLLICPYSCPIGIQMPREFCTVCHTERTRQLITTLLSLFSEAWAIHWANSTCEWVGASYPMFRVNNSFHPSACFLKSSLAAARQLSENRPCVQAIISLISQDISPTVEHWGVYIA